MNEIINVSNDNLKNKNSLAFIEAFLSEYVNSVFSNENSSFSNITSLNNTKLFIHKTKFGKLMSDLIGLHEVEGRAPSIITKNNENAQWCAYTVSYALELSVGKNKLNKFGIDFAKSPLFKKTKTGTWAAVSEYQVWGQKSTVVDSNGHSATRYNAIAQAHVSQKNMDNDRIVREKQIRAQLANNEPITKMKEGDLIIWKGSYACKTDVGVKTFKSSHIGMIEKITRDKKGEYYVWVIEGNANEAVSDDKYERYINKTDSVIGNQKAGEIIEQNVDDGIIRKCYSVKELANFGYSGYINMSGIV